MMLQQHAAVKEPLPKTSVSPTLPCRAYSTGMIRPVSLTLQSLWRCCQQNLHALIKRLPQHVDTVDKINNPQKCSPARPPQANNARRPCHLHRQDPLKHHLFFHSFLPLSHLADYLRLRKHRLPGQSSWHQSSCKRLQTRQAALPQVILENTILDESN